MKNPLYPARTAFAVVTIISACALCFAFIMQYAGHLDPCHLCLLQRWPYGVNVAVGILGVLLTRSDSNRRVAFGLLLTGLIFAGETTLAGYHAGVERHWWHSAFETCTVSFDSAKDILAQIEARPAARCDQIAWSFLSLSMADWNIVYALAATVFSGAASLTAYRRARLR